MNTHKLTLTEELVLKEAGVNPQSRAIIGRAGRTAALLARFRGNPDEFYMLKGVLCMGHGDNTREDERLINSVFDLVAIAERMDELNGRTVKK